MFLLYTIMPLPPPPTSYCNILPEAISSGRDVNNHLVKFSYFIDAETETQRIVKNTQLELVPRLLAPCLGFSHNPQQHSRPKFSLVPEQHTCLTPAHKFAGVVLI